MSYNYKRYNPFDRFDRSSVKLFKGETNRRTRGMARYMRKNPTAAELRMIMALGDFGEDPILTQVTIQNMIIDIALPKRNLLIEVDGGSHSSKAAKEKDEKRDELLTSFGFQIARISNHKTWNRNHIKLLIGQYPVSDDNAYKYTIAKRRALKGKLYKKTA